jgi:hypothetical protein
VAEIFEALIPVHRMRDTGILRQNYDGEMLCNQNMMTEIYFVAKKRGKRYTLKLKYEKRDLLCSQNTMIKRNFVAVKL